MSKETGGAIKRVIGTPTDGWKERTWYLVDVAYHADNPIHRALFFTGFLNGENGLPGGYNHILSIGGGYEREYEMREAVYLMPVKWLFSENDLDGGENRYITPYMLAERSKP